MVYIQLSVHWPMICYGQIDYMLNCKYMVVDINCGLSSFNWLIQW